MLKVPAFECCRVLRCSLVRAGALRQSSLIQGVRGVQIVRQLDPLRSAVEALKQNGVLALVPTMGALHDGHLALIRAAQAQAVHVVVSIFVNPRQFGVGEDLERYPRQMDADRALLEAEGVSLLWVPDAAVMYPASYATNIAVSGISAGLCGAARPGHFDGVATVVCKLFNQVRPDLAVFGEKDWQQLAVIRHMARDLDLLFPRADAIHAVPIVREDDGLARSSRNAFLSPADRIAAAALPRAMQRALSAIRSGSAINAALAAFTVEVLAGGFSAIDYAELCDAESLETLTAVRGQPARLLVAARIGATRLIDNMPL